MSAPEFRIVDTPRGSLVICVYNGQTGAARVFSNRVQDAQDRAEAQARGKAAEQRDA